MAQLTLELRSSKFLMFFADTSEDAHRCCHDLAVVLLIFLYLLNRYRFLKIQTYFLKGNVLLCVHFYQIEPLSVFIFNK